MDIEGRISTAERGVGARLSYEVVRRHGSRGLPDATIRVHLCGAAGQSFGAFLARGIALNLIGVANDYVAKGLSGGRITLRTPREAAYEGSESAIAGNAGSTGRRRENSTSTDWRASALPYATRGRWQWLRGWGITAASI